MKIYKPVDNILTQGFGENRTCAKIENGLIVSCINKPFYGCPIGYSSLYNLLGMDGHNGYDFNGKIGDDIIFNVDKEDWDTEWVATNEVDKDGGLGVLVTSTKPNEQGDYVKVIFWHISKSLVKNGDKVVFGQRIAEVGNTGASTAPHLHWAIKFIDRYGNTLYKNNGYLGSQKVTIIDTFVLELEVFKLPRIKKGVLDVVNQLELLYETADLNQIKALNVTFISLLKAINEEI